MTKKLAPKPSTPTIINIIFYFSGELGFYEHASDQIMRRTPSFYDGIVQSWTSDYRETALSARNFKERLWRGADINDNIGRRDIVVQYVKDRHDEITDYKQVRYKPTA